MMGTPTASTAWLSSAAATGQRHGPPHGLQYRQAARLPWYIFVPDYGGGGSVGLHSGRGEKMGTPTASIEWLSSVAATGAASRPASTPPTPPSCPPSMMKM